MKSSILETGICTTVTAAAVVALAGLVPATAHGAPLAPEMATKLAGKTVFLDPGHQGGGHSENLARQVSDGRGGTKDCQTTGMTTVNGVPEHTVAWNISQLVKTSLESLGAKVVLSRQDDTGWGGCIDDRARAANQSGAAVALSIHADSAPADYRGFHVIVPQLPIPDAKADQVQSGAGRSASIAMRDAYLQAGFPAATYAGVQDGLQTRADVAGPALTTVPDVFLEMGNGANPADAALLESQEGQLKHAIAITTGLVGYLLGAAPAATPAQSPSGSATDRAALAPAAPQAAPAPQTQTLPGSPQAQAAPGTPQVQTGPGAPSVQNTPGTPSAPKSSTTDMAGLVGTIINLLFPLARQLGVDNSMVTSQLLNVAYTLAATLLSPAR